MNPKEEIKELQRELESERSQRKAAEARVAELYKWFGENRIHLCTVKELREAETRAVAAEEYSENVVRNGQRAVDAARERALEAQKRLEEIRANTLSTNAILTRVLSWLQWKR